MSAINRNRKPFDIEHYDIRLDELLAPIDGNKSESHNFLHRLMNKPTKETPRLSIPYWQRDYDWGEALISRFFCKLVDTASTESANAQEDRPLRLGTIVLGRLIQRTADCQYQPYEFLVIDGQQRLRTVNTLFRKAQIDLKLFADEPLGLPLYYGVGDEQVNLSDINEVNQSLITAKQKTAFDVSKLRELGLEKRKLREWMHNIEVHLIVTNFTFDARRKDINTFDKVMSRLFSRVNLQARPLGDLDIVKAQLLFRLRQFGHIKEAQRLNVAWEKARALIVTCGEASEKNIDALLNTTILDADPKSNVFVKAFGKAPTLSLDETRMGFTRYLLLVLAFAQNNSTLLKHHRSQEILKREGVLWECFNPLCNSANADEIVVFVNAIEAVNSIFLRWRPFLLMSRARLTQDVAPEETEKNPLLRQQWNFLRFQCYLASSSSSDRVWLENPMLFELLKAISAKEATAGRKVALTKQEAIFHDLLQEAQGKLFEKLDAKNVETSGTHDVLVARDWFLWQAFIEKEPNCQKAAISGLKALLELNGGYARFGTDITPEDLYGNLCRHFKASRRMPTSTNADQIEHWVSIERGKSLEKDIQKRCDLIENKAHIATGTNQSIRDLSIKDKANQLDESWWPTLQFLAAISHEHDGRGIIRSQQNATNVSKFLNAIARFWETSAEACNRSNTAICTSDDDVPGSPNGMTVNDNQA